MNSTKPSGEILLFQTEDWRPKVQVRFDDKIVWLSQSQIAELIQTTPQNITIHLKAIYDEGELDVAPTCKDYLQVQSEGERRQLLRLAS